MIIGNYFLHTWDLDSILFGQHVNKYTTLVKCTLCICSTAKVDQSGFNLVILMADQLTQAQLLEALRYIGRVHWLKVSNVFNSRELPG